MAFNRILSRGSIFYEIGTHSIFEETYEKMLLQFSAELFPDHFCIEFKGELDVPRQNNVKPDLVLIDKMYQEWVLVEVEVARHSWSGHVGDQIERLELASLPNRGLEKLLSKEPSLDARRTELLVRSQLQRVLVVCNDSPRWQDKFAQTSAELLIVRPFRNERHELLLQSERDFRRRYRHVLTGLEPPTRSQPGWYKIDSPHAVPLDQENVAVVFDNEVVAGKIRRIGFEWFLVVSHGLSIVSNGPLGIVGVIDHLFEINGKVVENDD